MIKKKDINDIAADVFLVEKINCNLKQWWVLCWMASQIKLTVRYHFGGSKELNAHILLLAYMVYL
jgi:hypothetical protein